MNYANWYKEYDAEAQRIMKVIEKLKSDRKNSSLVSKRELDNKIAYYRSIYVECLSAANILSVRYGGEEQ